jgi:hypothetical protein
MVTIAFEGLESLDLCSAPRAFEQGGIFIMQHLLRQSHHASVFMVSSEVQTHLVASYNTQEVDLFSVFFLPIGTGTGTHSIGKNGGKIEQIGNLLPLYLQSI